MMGILSHYVVITLKIISLCLIHFLLRNLIRLKENNCWKVQKHNFKPEKKVVTQEFGAKVK